jgi:hypothetical protein
MSGSVTIHQFLKPRLIGERFEDGTIPLEVLADLSVLSEMLTEVAKWRYRERHPERRLVPRGFLNGCTLRLTHVERGSAMPVISLVVPAAIAPDGLQQACFEEARSAIVQAIGAAAGNCPITTFLPQRYLGYFDRFGRHLGEDEAIEFTDRPGTTPVRLTQHVRRVLILASSAEEFTQESSVHGQIHEFDQRSLTFQLTRLDGSVLRDIPVADHDYDTVLEANAGFRKQVRVRIRGIGRFDRNGRLRGLEKVDEITLLDPLDVPLRIEELKQLRAGWLDGKGVAPLAQGLDWLAGAFEQYYPPQATLPYLFPTPEGQVLAEWSLGPWAPSLEIDLETRQGQWHLYNQQTQTESNETFDLNQPAAWSNLAARIGTMSGELA